VLAAGDRSRAAPTFAADGLYFAGPYYDAAVAMPERSAAMDWLPPGPVTLRVNPPMNQPHPNQDLRPDPRGRCRCRGRGRRRRGRLRDVRAEPALDQRSPRAAELARRLPPFVMPVALFVNAEDALVDAAIAAIPQLLLQFHGDESPQACAAPGARSCAPRASRPGSIC